MTAGEQARLATLIPEARERVEKLLAAMEARGMPVYVGQTRRTAAQQHDAQARGTTSVKQSVSWHELDRAADLRKRLPDGTPDQTTRDEAFFLALYEEAKALGLRSLAYQLVDGGLRKLLINGHVWDAGHVEWRQPFATLAEAIVAEGERIA
jgi:hypothetical protein